MSIDLRGPELQVAANVVPKLNYDDEKSAAVDEEQHDTASESDVDSLDKEAQYGIKAMQATAVTWTKWSLIAAYVALFVVYFVNSLQQQQSFSYSFYVTSQFKMHSLVPTTGVVSSIVGGVTKLPIAKLIDVVGRVEGYLFMVLCATVGLVMMAACKNVETYAAAQVFYWVGMNGMNYVMDVFVADTSSLRNRGLMFAFTTSPFIATTFAGPKLGEAFLAGTSWRWGYGAFAIITPIICAPVAGIFWVNKQKAIKSGLLQRQPSGRTFLQSVWFYFVEFDIFGVLLIAGGFSLFLLPFSLVKTAENQWLNPSMIAMLIVGGLMLIAFALYERFVAPKPFIPFHLLLDRTVAAACTLAATLFISFYCWDGYLPSYLLVGYNLTYAHAGYVNNTYNLGSCAWGIVTGLAIRRWGRIKWFAVAAMPVMFLGCGLLIHFRQPHQGIGYVVMCQVFIAVAGGTLVICEELAVMASGAHENVATLLALIGMFSSVGGAIGNTIAAAIWTNVIPGELAKRLPAEDATLATSLYQSAAEVLKNYPVGTPEREAVSQAYGVAQRYLAITGTAVLVVGMSAIFLWRDIDVRKFKQVKGRVV